MALLSGTALLGGCSVSMPMGSLLGDDETGTIAKPQLDGLVGEDWRRAKAALAQALGTVEAKAPVTWTNPDTGVKGSFAPVGAAYSTASGTCRAFSAAVNHNDVDDSLQGTACSDKSGAWQVTDVRPLKS